MALVVNVQNMVEALESLSATSQQRAKKSARGGLCPRAAKTGYSSWERQQGSKIQSVPAPRTAFHGTVCPCCLSIHIIQRPGAVAERYERILLQPLGRDPHGRAGCCLVAAVGPPWVKGVRREACRLLP